MTFDAPNGVQKGWGKVFHEWKTHPLCRAGRGKIRSHDPADAWNVTAAGNCGAKVSASSRPAVPGWMQKAGYTRKTAPSFLPSSKLLPIRVAVRNAIAQTPSAAATYRPVPSSWNSS